MKKNNTQKLGIEYILSAGEFGSVVKSTDSSLGPGFSSQAQLGRSNHLVSTIPGDAALFNGL